MSALLRSVLKGNEAGDVIVIWDLWTCESEEKQSGSAGRRSGESSSIPRRRRNRREENLGGFSGVEFRRITTRGRVWRDWSPGRLRSIHKDTPRQKKDKVVVMAM